MNAKAALIWASQHFALNPWKSAVRHEEPLKSVMKSCARSGLIQSKEQYVLWAPTAWTGSSEILEQGVCLNVQ